MVERHSWTQGRPLADEISGGDLENKSRKERTRQLPMLVLTDRNRGPFREVKTQRRWSKDTPVTTTLASIPQHGKVAARRL